MFPSEWTSDEVFSLTERATFWVVHRRPDAKQVVNMSLNGMKDLSASTSSPPPLFMFKEGCKATGEGKAGITW